MNMLSIKFKCYILILFPFLRFASACGKLKELAKASDIANNQNNVTEFIRHLTCAQEDHSLSFRQCIAECMCLDSCDAVRYTVSCELCEITVERFDGDFDLRVWFVELNSLGKYH